jgi:hypothetical protein
VPAALWRRFLASVIDVTNVVVAITLPSMLVTLLALLSDRVGDLLDRLLSRAQGQAEAGTPTARRIRVCQIGAVVVTEVQRRNHQTYGQKLMRIRRVDAADGGPVRATSAIMRHFVSQLLWASVRRATRQAAQQRTDELKALKTELPELKRTAADPDAFREEAMEMLRERAISSVTFTFAAPVLQLAVQTLCMLASPKRQSVSELAAGIATTTDKSARAEI